MRSRALVSVAAACGVLAGITLDGPPAAALTCAEHPDGSPRAIAAGTESLATADRFFDRYDFAVLGTVTHIDTVGEGGPDHGATAVTLEAAAVLGLRTAPARLSLSSPDPGWLAGHPYEAGNGYFIPVRARGPDGEANYTFLCDPITEVDDVSALAGELAPLAADAGIALSIPGGEPADPRTGDQHDLIAEPRPPSAVSQATDRTFVLVAGLAAAAIGLAGGALHRHARRSRGHRG